MCSTVVGNLTFVVMCSCAPNRNVCMGLQYAHKVVSENNPDVCQRAVALQSDLSCNFKPQKDSRAVTQYVERPYMTCSFQGMHASTNK